MANKTTDIELNLKNLDEATEKTNQLVKQLVGYLEEAMQIINSLPHDILDTTDTDIDAIAGLIAEKLKEDSCKNKET